MENHPFRGVCIFEQNGVSCGAPETDPIHYNWAVEEEATAVEQPQQDQSGGVVPDEH